MDLDDLDLDPDASWPLDQIAFASPLAFSSSEQLCAPLWAFSDPRGEGTHDSVTKNSTANEDGYDSIQVPPPFMGPMPIGSLGRYCGIKERMSQALRYFKESTEQHVLAQVWAPVKNRGRFVLTTSGQPFVLDPGSNGLSQYRMVSLMYIFSLDGNHGGELGLPGRVFRRKLPEWTPNVQYYSSKEFFRLVHALHYNVQGTLALPVFESSGKLCIGVVELILTSQKINYAPEVEKVCKALKAVNLRTSEILEHKTTQICNQGRQNAMAEILGILTVVCETLKLPLAQTWVPCKHQSVLADGGGLRKTCSSFDDSCMGRVCMSTSDIAFYIVDAHMWGFREACVEHHLQTGQGVSGTAFSSGNLSFCRDVSQFCKTQYPLVHYARMFKLKSCFAICLKSDHTGDDDYVLEFFLPPNIADDEEIDNLLGLMLGTMKQHFKSLKITSGIELGENEAFVEIVEASADKFHSRLESIRISSPAKLALRSKASENENDLLVVLNYDPINKEGNAGDLVKSGPASFPEVKDARKLEKKRGKAEKAISLEVLQQHFSGSLKDAAKSLGVCPTTMKRICRQHGISRWPSRKINKVSRSLTKLKHVIKSVQCSERAIDFSSVTPSDVVQVPWSSNLRMVNQGYPPSSKAPGTQAQTTYLCNYISVGKEGQLLDRRVLAPSHGFEAQNDCKESSPACDKSKMRGGLREESSGTEASQGSCEANPAIENVPPKDHISTSKNDYCITGFGSNELRATRDFDLSAVVSGSGPHFTTKPQDQSQKTKDEAVELKSISIKASYRADIIRFRIPMSCAIMELKEEVAKRLKLELSTFDVKYMNDDGEWVLISCDADLHECLSISISSGSSIVRLSVHELVPNLGSSCESIGQCTNNQDQTRF